MPTPATPPAPQSAGDDRNLVAVDANYKPVTWEDELHLTWKKHGNLILSICGLALLGIVGKGGWDYLAGQRELEVENAYAAATTPVQLKAFVAAHVDHALGVVAQLRIADEAYTAGKSAEALSGYEKTLTLIKDGPLAARAKLGQAMAKIQAGKATEGAAELKQLANDANQLKGVRVEAAYQLASLAAEKGETADVQKFSDQLMQIDPASPWTQRAMALRASLPAAAAAVPAPAGKEAPSMQIKLPGK
jgi:hypothetical protein